MIGFELWATLVGDAPHAGYYPKVVESFSDPAPPDLLTASGGACTDGSEGAVDGCL